MDNASISILTENTPSGNTITLVCNWEYPEIVTQGQHFSVPCSLRKECNNTKVFGMATVLYNCATITATELSRC